MRLGELTEILGGYHTRGSVEPHEDGSHFLVQARDVDGERLTCRVDALIRFNPEPTRIAGILKTNDILFMARGSRNHSVLLGEIPGPALAAAYFFIVRASDDRLLPTFLCWYLNQASVERYLTRHSGRGVHMPVVRRSVLESLEIPLPDLGTQKKIVELDLLRKAEKDLSNRLAEKRGLLIEAVCLYQVGRNRSMETPDE